MEALAIAGPIPRPNEITTIQKVWIVWRLAFPDLRLAKVGAVSGDMSYFGCVFTRRRGARSTRQLRLVEPATAIETITGHS